MFKTVVSIFLSFFILSACNNRQGDQPVSGVETVAPDKEKALLDSTLQFPDSLLLKERLIQYYREKDDYAKAISTTDGFLKTDSLNARLWEIKGNLYFEDLDTVKAIRCFETALQLSPTANYLMQLGSLYAKAKDKKALFAADVLQEKFKGTEREAFYIRGLYHTYTGDKPTAIELFDKCLQFDYNYMPAYLEKAIAFYDQAKYEEALKVLDKAVTLQNKFDEGYFWKGRCLEKLNRPDEAIEEYRTALLYSPDYTDAKDALERLHAK